MDFDSELSYLLSLVQYNITSLEKLQLISRKCEHDTAFFMEIKRSGGTQTLVCACSYNDHMDLCQELDGLSTDESSISRVRVGIFEKGLSQNCWGVKVPTLSQINLPEIYLSSPLRWLR